MSIDKWDGWWDYLIPARSGYVAIKDTPSDGCMEWMYCTVWCVHFVSVRKQHSGGWSLDIGLIIRVSIESRVPQNAFFYDPSMTNYKRRGRVMMLLREKEFIIFTSHPKRNYGRFIMKNYCITVLFWMQLHTLGGEERCVRSGGTIEEPFICHEEGPVPSNDRVNGLTPLPRVS